MTQLAVGYRSLQENGREKKTDGLWTHLGPLRMRGSVWVMDPNYVMYWGDGQHYLQYAPAGQLDLLAWTHRFQCTGLSVLGPASSVSLPAGSVQARLGQYYSNSDWKLPQSSVWTESDVRVNVTTTGVEVRLEYDLCVYASGVAGPGNLYVGLGLDGSVSWPNLGMFSFLNGSHFGHLSGCIYVTPTAGSHRFGVFLLGVTGTGLSNQNNSRLFVTEQRA